MFLYYNPNPRGKAVGDCVVRALSKALQVPWETAYAMVTAEGYIQCDMPSANAVWGAVLSKAGLDRHLAEDGMTAGDFAKLNPDGVYVLALSGHVVCVVDGTIYDTWDSSAEIVIYFWEAD